MLNLFRPQTFPFWKENKNGYAILQRDGYYRDGMIKMVLRFYYPDGRYHSAYFVGSGAPYAQVIEHPSKDWAGSGRPIPEGWYFMDVPIRMGTIEPGIGRVKIPCDQTRFAQNNRSELLIHIDENKQAYRGTVGCIFLAVDSDMEKVCTAQKETNCTLLIVDYDLGVVDATIAQAQSKKDRKCFEWIYSFTKQWEGGYVNHPSDPGGRTNFGITQAVATQHGLGDVANLTPEVAKEFYFEKYYVQWAKSWFINAAMFDTAVNFGLQGSREFLQEALGFRPDEVDGKVGAVTMDRFNKANHDKLALTICQKRIEYRHLRVKQSSSQRDFLQGWLNRDNALMKKLTK